MEGFQKENLLCWVDIDVTCVFLETGHRDECDGHRIRTDFEAYISFAVCDV